MNADDIRRNAWAMPLDGAFLTSRAAMRQMIARGLSGSMVFMGSVHSKQASVLKGPNVAAKHGLEGLTKVIANLISIALLFAAFPSNALTGQSLVVSHGWFMQ